MAPMNSVFGRITTIAVFAVSLILMFQVSSNRQDTPLTVIAFILSGSMAYFLLRMMLSFFYAPATSTPNEDHLVSVVIPSFNESRSSVLATLKSLEEQDYPIHEIIFVDDGSQSTEALSLVQEIASETLTQHVKHRGAWKVHTPKVVAHRFAKNKGKKQAQAYGFQRATGDILMTVDSDGYIYSDALRELLRPMADEKVGSVVGHITARNYAANFMTRLQDVLYQSAFRVGRGAQSITGTVLVCSGALSVHRRHIIIKELDLFLKSQALGIQISTGDDRLLTAISLRAGKKTKYQSTAQAITDVPTTLKSFFIQQTRWSRSFFGIGAYSLTFAWRRPFFFFWTLMELLIWFAFIISLVTTLSFSLGTGALIWLLYMAALLILTTLGHGVYYAFKNPLVYLASPFFGVAHMAILLPVRLYALATLNKDIWGTREVQSTVKA